MKNEIKIGDCFKDTKWNEGDMFIVTQILDSGDRCSVVAALTGSSIARFDIPAEHFGLFCQPITLDEFDAALDATFAAIKAELPEVK